MRRMYGPYRGVVRGWHDGDTGHIDLDLGFGFVLGAFDLDGRPTNSCRVAGIDAPELSTDAGVAALAYAVSICPPGAHVLVVSNGWDKYGGRFDGSLTLADGSDFAALMLGTGHAVPMEQ